MSIALNNFLYAMGVDDAEYPVGGTTGISVSLPKVLVEAVKEQSDMKLENLVKIIKLLMSGEQPKTLKDCQVRDVLASLGAVVAAKIRRANGDEFDEEESDEDDEEEDEDEECILCNSTNTIPGPCGPICEECLAEHGLVCKACEREARDRGLIEDKDEEAKNPAGVRCLKWNGSTWE